MHELTITRNADESADFELPQGCISCGGPLAIRMTPHGAASCCVPCRWISKPRVDLKGKTLQVAYVPGGEA